MPFFTKKTPKSLKKPPKWSDLWLFKEKPVKHVVFKMQLDSNTLTLDQHQDEGEEPLHLHRPSSGPAAASVDPTSLLSDSDLLHILSLLPVSQHKSISLVCRRWLSLAGRLRESLTLLDFPFLSSGRLFARFPNLTDVDLVPASIQTPQNSSIILTHAFLSLHLGSDFSSGCFFRDELLLPSDFIDNGLRVLARGCPNLRKLVLIAATVMGLSSVAAHCPTLQELELHRCTDLSLRAISACENLQILRLIGFLDGFYDSPVTDIGLTILAHGCRRLVKLELSGCEGSYDGISAIGQCCPMLEELTLCDHRMDGGWIAALSFCGNLKTLRLQGCKRIDSDPGSVEHLGSCLMLERLQLQRCQLRDKQSMMALFLVCGGVREIEFQDCWGLDNQMFGIASICRRVKFLSLEGCSLLTTEGLKSVILSWKELQRLRVVSCNNIKDGEVTPDLASLFSVLKDFKWQPDSRSVLASSLAGTGMGTRGGRFFKRA
ncbi:F-box protein At5g51370-like [Magnolia sinica]|uniref:F-box protein At5g51370-like n=1 Tax=Magnolia sinica TaxID=86752 RepID=UPI002658B2E9|nr:F-box protein At5g51370-like [Magnolia sinica]